MRKLRERFRERERGRERERERERRVGGRMKHSKKMRGGRETQRFYWQTGVKILVLPFYVCAF